VHGHAKTMQRPCQALGFAGWPPSIAASDLSPGQCKCGFGVYPFACWTVTTTVSVHIPNAWVARVVNVVCNGGVRTEIYED